MYLLNNIMAHQRAFSQLLPLTDPGLCDPTSTSPTLVSTSVHRVSEECGNIIRRMLLLQVHPETVALAAGVSICTVYHVQENCEANGGVFKIPKELSKAGWPCVMGKDDINVCPLSSALLRTSLRHNIVCTTVTQKTIPMFG